MPTDALKPLLEPDNAVGADMRQAVAQIFSLLAQQTGTFVQPGQLLFRMPEIRFSRLRLPDLCRFPDLCP